MGLLTDPSAGQGKIIKLLLNYYPKLCVLLYIIGVAYFCLLASPQINNATYFSENALLPGLVKTEFNAEGLVQMYHDELLDEMKNYDDSIPYPWLLAKFRQIGLDAYTHNFTLNYPLGKIQKFSGKNVYGILRAPRAASTEALVLTVPYRPPTSVHLTTAPSIAIMLAFAKYAIVHQFWAKDIIFLVTEHEQLGVQAWLEAYHGISCGLKDVLLHGDMKGRAGAIQAAINLEFHDLDVGKVDLKIEGLNGQLPNLDLFNLAAKICLRENLRVTFKNRIAMKVASPFKNFNLSWKFLSALPKKFKVFFKEWTYALETLLNMVGTQATGIPNGNHGLFYRFGIQALTIEGEKFKNGGPGVNVIGRILEGTFRSLNNLLERFHQSFFFYLLSAHDRYISIGLYIPAISLLLATLYIKAYSKWCQIHEQHSKETESENASGDATPKTLKKPTPVKRTLEEWIKCFEAELEKGKMDKNDNGFTKIWILFFAIHALSIAVFSLPQRAVNFGMEYGIPIDSSMTTLFSTAAILSILVPIFIKKPHTMSTSFLNILLLLELAAVLNWIAMFNISLAMFLGVIYVPLALLINPSNCASCGWIQRFIWLVAHPFAICFYVVLAYAFVSFSNESSGEILFRAFVSLQKAVRFSIEDYMIYGNKLYLIVVCLMLPIWTCFWFVAFTKPEAKKTDAKHAKVD